MQFLNFTLFPMASVRNDFFCFNKAATTPGVIGITGLYYQKSSMRIISLDADAPVKRRQTRRHFRALQHTLLRLTIYTVPLPSHHINTTNPQPQDPVEKTPDQQTLT